MSRMTLIDQFLATSGWADAQREPLAGDASHRAYMRLTKPDGSRSVLMDAPPDRGEDVRPFIGIARHLCTKGLSAPQLYAQDTNSGLLLIEDLGDALYARLLETRPELETEIYSAAVDVVSHLNQTKAPNDLQTYSSYVTAPLAALAYDWYQFGTAGQLSADTKQAFLDAFIPVLAKYDAHMSVLVQRDYHAENLLWLPDRSGVARVGLLDFQDAMRGHPVYDLVSVLQDARRDVPPALEAEMKVRFQTTNRQDSDAFDLAYAVFGLQRNLRILGVFARLCMRDNKVHYVDFIPRVWGHIQTNLKHPQLEQLAELLLTDLPAPTPEVLTVLKAKSGACAGR